MKRASTKRIKLWNKLPWKQVSLEDTDLGEFDESVLFGLEEIDGNAYKLTKNDNGYSLKVTGEDIVDLDFIDDNDNDNDDSLPTINEESSTPKKETKKKKTKKAKKLTNTTTKENESAVVPVGNSYWGNIELHHLLTNSLTHLGFLSPTPIQEKAIPVSIVGESDIVGAAGK